MAVLAVAAAAVVGVYVLALYVAIRLGFGWHLGFVSLVLFAAGPLMYIMNHIQNFRAARRIRRERNRR